MYTIDSAILDFRRFDILAAGDTWLHRLDPRAKVLVTALFVVLVISHDRYTINTLFPFFIFPVAMASAGNLPAGYIIRKILLLFPFVIIVGIFNPLFDRAPMFTAGPIVISSGWISFASILIRSSLTVSSAFMLLALTGFPGLCRALEQFGLPRPFAVQLLFLYRYINVLTEAASQAARARQLRSCGKKGQGMASFTSLVGHLLLRTWQRAERVHIAMLARGFDGSFQTSRTSSFGRNEFCFVICWSIILLLLRSANLPQLIGGLITGGSQ